MPDSIDRSMRQVLAEMSVISEQKAHSHDGIRVHGGDKSRLPALSDKPMLDYWRDRYNRAYALSSRRAVLEEAREALELARRTPIPAGQEPAFGSPQWKRYIAESADDGGTLARRFGVTRQYIWQIRLAYGKSAG